MLKNKLKYMILLHINFVFFSIVGVLSKIAANIPFLSFEYVMLIFCMLLILFTYALLWQIVLKNIRLSTAYASRSVLIILGFFWGWLFFKETIKVTMILGSLVILLGVWLVSTEDQ